MTFPITALYAALVTLIYLALIMRIEQLRGRYKVGLGDGGVPELTRAIRAQGNAAEHLPITLILLGLAEARGLSSTWLHVAGASFVIGRVLHGWGLNRSAGTTFGRAVGVSANWLVMIGLALYLLLKTL